MYYVCKEDNIVTTILNYRPNVPASVTVIEISDEQYNLIGNGKYHFNVDNDKVELRPASELQAEETEKANIEHREFLSSTDWKVLRHTREKALGIATSLTEDEYLALEQQREDAARAIR